MRERGKEKEDREREKEKMLMMTNVIGNWNLDDDEIAELSESNRNCFLKCQKNRYVDSK